MQPNFPAPQFSKNNRDQHPNPLAAFVGTGPLGPGFGSAPRGDRGVDGGGIGAESGARDNVDQRLREKTAMVGANQVDFTADRALAGQATYGAG